MNDYYIVFAGSAQGLLTDPNEYGDKPLECMKVGNFFT